MKTQICDAPGCGAPAMGDDVAFWSGNLCGECWTEKFKPSHLRDPVAAYPVERRETIRWLRGVVASIMLMVAVPLLSGCATLTESPMTTIALSFSNGESGECTLTNKRAGEFQNRVDVPATVSIRKSDDDLVYRCQTESGKSSSGAIPSRMGGKIVASAVFLDFGIVDAITDNHREYPPVFVIPVGVESSSTGVSNACHTATSRAVTMAVKMNDANNNPSMPIESRVKLRQAYNAALGKRAAACLSA